MLPSPLSLCAVTVTVCGSSKLGARLGSSWGLGCDTDVDPVDETLGRPRRSTVFHAACSVSHAVLGALALAAAAGASPLPAAAAAALHATFTAPAGPNKRIHGTRRAMNVEVDAGGMDSSKGSMATAEALTRKTSYTHMRAASATAASRAPKSAAKCCKRTFHVHRGQGQKS